MLDSCTLFTHMFPGCFNDTGENNMESVFMKSCECQYVADGSEVIAKLRHIPNKRKHRKMRKVCIIIGCTVNDFTGQINHRLAKLLSNFTIDSLVFGFLCILTQPITRQCINSLVELTTNMILVCHISLTSRAQQCSFQNIPTFSNIIIRRAR